MNHCRYCKKPLASFSVPVRVNGEFMGVAHVGCCQRKQKLQAARATRAQGIVDAITIISGLLMFLIDAWK